MTQLPILTPGVADYKFLLFDQDGILIQHIKSYKSALIRRVVNDTGLMVLELFENDPLADLFSLDSSEDFILEIHRENKKLGLASYIEWEGLVSSDIDDRRDSNNVRNFNVIGVSYLDFATRRNIRQLTLQIIKAGLGETILKEYANEEMGPGATVAGGRITFGVTEGLQIQADAGSGLATAQEVKMEESLLAKLQAIAKETLVDFDIVGIGPGQFEFRVYPQQRGLDRRYLDISSVTGLNAAGNTPMLFSVDRKNMQNPTFVRNVSSSKNAVLTFGGGQSSDPLFDITQDFIASSISKWGLRETIANSSSNTDPDTLASVSAAVLKNRRVIKTFTFDPISQLGSYYGKDYEFGSAISAIDNSGQLRHNKLIEVEIRLNNDGQKETLRHVFEELQEL